MRIANNFLAPEIKHSCIQKISKGSSPNIASNVRSI